MENDERQRIEEVYSGDLRQRRSSLYDWHRPEVQWSIYRMHSVLAWHLRGKRLQDLSGANICDVGCGNGSWLNFLINSGASPERLYGIDIIPERVISARCRLPHSVKIFEGNAVEIPYPDAQFDIVSANTVFSSILDSAIRSEVAEEIWRVVAPGGLAYILDFRLSDPRNKDTVGIGSKELKRLFPKGKHVSRSILILPPISRKIAPLCMPILGVMDWMLPFLRGHVATAIWKEQ